MLSHSHQIRALVAVVILAAGSTIGIADAFAKTVKPVKHHKAHRVAEPSTAAGGTLVRIGERLVRRLTADHFGGWPPPTTAASTSTPSQTTPPSASTSNPSETAPPSTSSSSTSSDPTSTASTSTSSSPTPTLSPTPSPTLLPTGLPGDWNLSFDDEFNGTSLNTTTWSTHDGWTNQNGVTALASNISVSGGYANLALSSASSGAAISTNSTLLGVGDFAEARVSLPGNGSMMSDWDAFWASGPDWPAAGENDVIESLGGEPTVNYHSPSGAHNQGLVSGNWGGGFHTYGIYRGINYADVFWDGVLVKHYSTDDDGLAQTLIFSAGNGQDDPVATGSDGTMRIDYLRVWTPAS